MLGTIVELDSNLVKILVKNDAACCGGGGAGGCACGAAEAVYIQAVNSGNISLEKGDMVEYSPQKSSFTGILKVFILPIVLFSLGWNLSPLIFGQTNQPMQFFSGFALGALAFLVNIFLPRSTDYPAIMGKVSNFNLKDFALPVS